MLKATIICLGFVSLCSGLGMLTHLEITHEAMRFQSLNGTHSGSILSQINQVDYFPYLQAGSFFPDWGYAFGFGELSEASHWQNFWRHSIDYVGVTYPQPYTRKALQLIAFLMGVISHGTSDVMWHSLANYDKGFIHVLQEMNFGGDYSAAHTLSDWGGDLLLSRWGHSRYHVSWSVPVTDIISIYATMNLTINYHQITSCIAGAYALKEIERGLGKYLVPLAVWRSPFLTQEYYSYFRGGLESLAIGVRECLALAEVWFLEGKMSIPCPHMGDEGWVEALLSSAEKPRVEKSTLCRRFQSALLKVERGKDTLSFQSTIFSWGVSQLCGVQDAYSMSQLFSSVQPDDQPTPAATPTPPRTLVLLGSTLFYAVRMALFDLIFHQKWCHNTESKNTTVITSVQDYARLGSALASGDFNGDGLQDLVMSATGSGPLGQVYVLPGPFISSLPKISVHDPEFLRVWLDGVELGSGFGTALATVDFNCDGIDDLAVSAPYIGSDRDLQDGAVFIFYGQEGVGLRVDGKYDVKIDGTITTRGDVGDERLQVLGEKLWAIDVDGDGFKDLLIGSPKATPIIGGAQRGTVMAFRSRKYGMERQELNYHDSDWFLSGSMEYEWFGSSLAVLPRGAMMIIGSPGYRSRASGLYTPGAVRVYNISTHSTSPSLTAIHYGSKNYGQFGSSIAVSTTHALVSSSTETSGNITLTPPKFPDLDGIFVREGMRGFQAGAVRLMAEQDLRDEDSVGNFTPFAQGSASMSQFGTRSIWAENGGWLVSEPVVQGERGRVYLLGGETSPTGPSPLLEQCKQCWQGWSYHQGFGAELLVGDFDGDGKQDLVVSSHHDPESSMDWSDGFLAGRIDIFWAFQG